MFKYKQLFVIAITLIITFFAHSKQIDYTHQGQNWSGACSSGKLQSPINIQNSATTLTDTILRLQYQSWNDVKVNNRVLPYWEFLVSIYLTNLTAQYDKQRPVNNKSQVTIQKTQKIRGSKQCKKAVYYPSQFHFHLHSEHTLNGIVHSLQMQINHRISVDYSTCLNFKDKIKLSILFQAQFFEDDNQFIKNLKLQEYVIQKKNHPAQTIIKGIGEQRQLQQIDPYFQNQVSGSFDVSYIKRVFAAQGYYHYDGSMSAPPCNQNIEWFIAKQPQIISNIQYQTFAFNMNNPSFRQIQNINDRIVYYSANVQRGNKVANLCYWLILLVIGVVVKLE